MREKFCFGIQCHSYLIICEVSWMLQMIEKLKVYIQVWLQAIIESNIEEREHILKIKHEYVWMFRDIK